MPDEDPPPCGAWAPSAAFRDAVRSVVLATLAQYLGIIETLADEAATERTSTTARRCTDTASTQVCRSDEVMVRTSLAQQVR